MAKESIFEKILGYSTGRNLTKLSLILAGVAISTFAMAELISSVLNFDLGFQVRDWIAISLVIPIFLIKKEILIPKSIPFIKDRFMKKSAYFIGLALIGLAISTIEFSLLDNLLNITFPAMPFLAVRNLVAAVLFSSVWIINNG
ncbi:MAG: hypothetical protein IIB81_03660 [Nanoarchaeota archaeon]|nr:hypothetical protein [Nanoarchaeota archaeon]